MAGIFEIGDIKAERGSLAKGNSCSAAERLFGSRIAILVANGAQDGPAVWLSSAVHGIELGGSEVSTAPQGRSTQGLRGTVIGAPIMNLAWGIRRADEL